MFGRVAGREDLRLRSPEQVVDDDPFPHGQSRLPRQVRVRADAGGEHDGIGGNGVAFLEQHAGDARAANDLSYVDGRTELHADALEMAGQDHSRARRELRRHQVTVRFEHRHIAAAFGQRAGGLQAQQAAADTDDLATGLGTLEDPVGIGVRAQRKYAPLVGPRNRRHERVRAAREHQTIERHGIAFV